MLLFGLKTSVSPFTRVFRQILGTKMRNFAELYVDDAIIGSATFITQLIHLKVAESKFESKVS